MKQIPLSLTLSACACASASWPVARRCSPRWCGCAGFSTTATPSPTAGAAFTGSVHGGQQPVYPAPKSTCSARQPPATPALPLSLLRPGHRHLDRRRRQPVRNHGRQAAPSASAPSPARPATTQTYLLAIGGNPGLSGSVQQHRHLRGRRHRRLQQHQHQHVRQHQRDHNRGAGNSGTAIRGWPRANRCSQYERCRSPACAMLSCSPRIWSPPTPARPAPPTSPAPAAFRRPKVDTLGERSGTLHQLSLFELQHALRQPVLGRRARPAAPQSAISSRRHALDSQEPGQQRSHDQRPDQCRSAVPAHPQLAARPMTGRSPSPTPAAA